MLWKNQSRLRRSEICGWLHCISSPCAVSVLWKQRLFEEQLDRINFSWASHCTKPNLDGHRHYARRSVCRNERQKNRLMCQHYHLGAWPNLKSPIKTEVLESMLPL